jgi:DNA-binding CsgD family transcriptional regulator
VRLRALIDHPAGLPEPAAASFAAGTAGIDPASASLADALFALDYGRFLLDSRQSKTAVAPLLIARKALTRLGAFHLGQECEAALAACGVSASAAHDRLGGTQLKSLTAREHVVARMVAHGLTNREVAADLSLSVKAVEYHLGNIFDKLGISSRRQVHAALAGHPSGGV